MKSPKSNKIKYSQRDYRKIYFQWLQRSNKIWQMKMILCERKVSFEELEISIILYKNSPHQVAYVWNFMKSKWKCHQRKKRLWNNEGNYRLIAQFRHLLLRSLSRVLSCNPIDDTVLGSQSLGFSRVRTLEWVTISLQWMKVKIEVVAADLMGLSWSTWFNSLQVLCPWDFPVRSVGGGAVLLWNLPDAHSNITGPI